MKLSELLDRRVVTESGDSLGRAFDLRVAWSGRRAELAGIAVARAGLAERLGIPSAGPLYGRGTHSRAHDVVPWSAVVRLRDGEIVVRDGTEFEPG